MYVAGVCVCVCVFYVYGLSVCAYTYVYVYTYAHTFANQQVVLVVMALPKKKGLATKRLA